MPSRRDGTDVDNIDGVFYPKNRGGRAYGGVVHIRAPKAERIGDRPIASGYMITGKSGLQRRTWMEYAVQYTISVLTGHYAQKYSVIIFDAARLEGLLKAAGSPLAGIAADAPAREYDPYECFQELMRVLKKVSSKPFCTAIVRERDGVQTRGARFDDEDESGVFRLDAHGFSGQCTRDGSVSEFERMDGKNGVYRAEMSTVRAVFKEDLMNLLNLCEETLAKDARLIARTVPNDTPAPAPLFQL